jgi:N-acetylglucosamine-6-phosphate deacetylase
LDIKNLLADGGASNMTQIIKGRIVTPEAIIRGAITVADGRIQDIIEGDPLPNDVCHDCGDALILPGFIDLHLHGVGPYGMAEKDDMLGASEIQLTFGTTGFCPTTASLSLDEYVSFVRKVGEAQANAQGAEIIGAHLEGPFINPVRKGGMKDDALRMPSVDECSRYLAEADGAMALMTLSPELDGCLDVVRLLRKHGVAVSMGHTDIDPSDLAKAIEAGVHHVCHLFNTFDRPIVPDGGCWPESLIPSILANDGLTCELICDLHHVSPTYLKIAVRTLGPDRFVAITDAMQGAGLPPGIYPTADGREYSTESGVGRTTSDNRIVGSVMTMNRSFANLVDAIGIDPVLAARFTSLNAARVLGIDDTVGSLEPGKRANIAVLNNNYDCLATFVDGALRYER